LDFSALHFLLSLLTDKKKKNSSLSPLWVCVCVVVVVFFDKSEECIKKSAEGRNP
jgi:hypothetical protein